MNYASSVAGRAILAVDRFFNGAMTSAWTSILDHQDTLNRQARERREQPPAEEDYGGGDICSLQEAAPMEDDQPLE